MASSEHIPKEIVAEILRRLPPKSLIRCTAVSKSWRDLISHPSFISAHLRHSPRLFLIQLSDERLYHNPSVTHCDRPLPSGSSSDPDSTSALLLPPTASDREFSVVGVCDGLVCLTADDNCRSLVVCNPSIRRYVSLPRPQHYRSLYSATVGFGFDSISEDYKVVRISCMLDDERHGFSAPDVEVYSLATGSWRNLSDAAPVCSLSYVGRDAAHGFVDGIVHWGAKRKEGDGWYHFVLSFDFAYEVFGEISLPERLGYEYGDSAAVIQGEEGLTVYCMTGSSPCCCDIWVMEEYGVVESWNKVSSYSFRGFVLEVPALGILLESVTSPPMALYIRKGGEVLLLVDKARKASLYSLDIARKRFTELGIEEGFTWYLYAFYYAESLVLLNKASDMVSYSRGTRLYLKVWK